AGGCPIMNTAIEADHAHPGLRQRAQAAMNGWHGLVRRIVEAGIRAGEIRSSVDPQEVASIVIACIEGAVMLSHLHGYTVHVAAARNHLTRFIDRELRSHRGEP